MSENLRATHILRVIEKIGRVSTSYLSYELDVSIETIRRDLRKLEKNGEIIRVHGGAIGKEYIDEGKSFNNRAHNNIDEKKYLVNKAISHIYRNSVIGLDASSSSWLLAQSIPNIRCTIVTNSINNINALSGHSNISIISLGGNYSEKYKAFYGMIAKNTLSKMTLDLCFISCDGFDETSGIWESNEYNLDIKKEFIKASEKVILIADKSKYKKKSLLKLCEFNEVDQIITNEK